MASEKPQPSMVDDQYRGLLTEREREILRGEADVSENYRYRVVSRVRTKLEALEADVGLLEEHRPDLHDELSDAVCGEREQPDTAHEVDIRALLNDVQDAFEALETPPDREATTRHLKQLQANLEAYTDD